MSYSLLVQLYLVASYNLVYYLLLAGSDHAAAAFVTYDANMRDIGLGMDLQTHADAAQVSGRVTKNVCL